MSDTFIQNKNTQKPPEMAVFVDSCESSLVISPTLTALSVY